MALSIHTTDIQLGYERIPPNLSIETRSAKLELHQKHAKINIRTEKPRILIDQYECFASAGLKGNADFMKEAAQRGYQNAMEVIGKRAQDGRMLAAIEKGGNPIAYIARRDSFPEHEFVLDFIPKARPKIDVTGDLQIEPERNWEGANNGVEGNYIPADVNIDYTPGRITVNVLQYPSVEIKYLGNSFDTSI